MNPCTVEGCLQPRLRHGKGLKLTRTMCREHWNVQQVQRKKEIEADPSRQLTPRTPCRCGCGRMTKRYQGGWFSPTCYNQAHFGQPRAPR